MAGPGSRRYRLSGKQRAQVRYAITLMARLLNAYDHYTGTEIFKEGGQEVPGSRTSAAAILLNWQDALTLRE